MEDSAKLVSCAPPPNWQLTNTLMFAELVKIGSTEVKAFSRR
jgi:hypothetical protein